jgi:hypothetical protein
VRFPSSILPLRWLAGRWFWPTLWALLLAPHFFCGPPAADFELRCGLPRITSGDEPDYLIAVHSLQRDGDLDLKNNYDAAQRGGSDGGGTLAGRTHLRHVTYWIGGVHVPWFRVFDDDRPLPGGAGYEKRPGAPAAVERLPEYPSHPAGLALVLATALWPWRDSARLESYALLLTGLVTCAAAWGFSRLARLLGADAPWARALAALAFLGTPAWHYGRTLVSEPWLLALAVLALHAALGARRGQSWRFAVGGAALGLGVWMKPPFALVAGPLLGWLAWSRRWRDLAAFAAPLAVACVGLLAYDTMLWGSPWHTPQPWRGGHPLVALLGVWIIPGKSLCFCAPILLPAALAWPRLLRAQPAPARLVLAAVLPYAALMLAWEEWHGGYGYGLRLLLPVLPLLLLAGVAWPALWREGGLRPGTRCALPALIAVSLLVNLAAVVCYGPLWADPGRWIQLR